MSLYSVSDGILRFKNRFFISSHYVLKPSLLQELHATLVAGHARVKRTLVCLSTLLLATYAQGCGVICRLLLIVSANKIFNLGTYRPSSTFAYTFTGLGGSYRRLYYYRFTFLPWVHNYLSSC